MPIVKFPILFAVMSDPNDLGMISNLEQTFPDDHIEIRPGQWFVVTSGTAKELSQKLGITPGGKTGQAVILSVGGYYGIASSEIWEWVAAKAGRPVHAA